jgi:hypothetical protein
MTDTTDKTSAKDYTLERDCELRFEIESKIQVVVEVCVLFTFHHFRKFKVFVLAKVRFRRIIRNGAGKVKEVHISPRRESRNFLLPRMYFGDSGKSRRLLHREGNANDPILEHSLGDRADESKSRRKRHNGSNNNGVWSNGCRKVNTLPNPHQLRGAARASADFCRPGCWTRNNFCPWNNLLPSYRKTGFHGGRILAISTACCSFRAQSKLLFIIFSLMLTIFDDFNLRVRTSTTNSTRFACQHLPTSRQNV